MDTSKGYVGDTVLGEDVDAIGENTVQGFSNHRQISGILKDLKSGGSDSHPILEEEIHPHPWETPQPLHEIPNP